MISKKVTSRHDATTLGIHLGINHDDVKYHVTNYDVRDAAYRFLCWADENYGPVERWEKIIEALEALEKNTTIGELDLRERLANAKQEKPVQNSVKIKTNSVTCVPFSSSSSLLSEFKSAAKADMLVSGGLRQKWSKKFELQQINNTKLIWYF